MSDATLEVLLIRLGGRRYALPLADVVYVATLTPEFRAQGGDCETHFVFEGEPIGYVSLWDALHQPSEYTEYEEMIASLPQRKQDHLDWMAALERSIHGSEPFSKARDPRACAFGKWYYGYMPKDRRLVMLLAQFEQPHDLIHGLADRLLTLAESGQVDEAMRGLKEAHDTTLKQLLTLFDSALVLLNELRRRIAVIIGTGDERRALGADGVISIVTLPGERYRHDGKQVAGGRAPTAGLLILDDQSVVPMLNWRGFGTENMTV